MKTEQPKSYLKMKRSKQTTARQRGEWQGMNWIRQEKRLAIYLRDGCACAYCGDSIENSAILSLDHLIPSSRNGSNHESNLITACKFCNDSRGASSLSSFVRTVAARTGKVAKDISAYIHRQTRRVLPKAEAKKLIERRGSAAKAIAKPF